MWLSWYVPARICYSWHQLQLIQLYSLRRNVWTWDYNTPNVTYQYLCLIVGRARGCVSMHVCFFTCVDRWLLRRTSGLSWRPPSCFRLRVETISSTIGSFYTAWALPDCGKSDSGSSQVWSSHACIPDFSSANNLPCLKLLICFSFIYFLFFLTFPCLKYFTRSSMSTFCTAWNSSLVVFCQLSESLVRAYASMAKFLMSKMLLMCYNMTYFTSILTSVWSELSEGLQWRVSLSPPTGTFKIFVLELCCRMEYSHWNKLFGGYQIV